MLLQQKDSLESQRLGCFLPLSLFLHVPPEHEEYRRPNCQEYRPGPIHDRIAKRFYEFPANDPSDAEADKIIYATNPRLNLPLLLHRAKRVAEEEEEY